jgi:O-antigen/teichoic acid export membrane protein
LKKALTLLLVLVALVFATVTPASALNGRGDYRAIESGEKGEKTFPETANTVRVFYAGDENLRVALDLARQSDGERPPANFVFVDDPSQADVFLLNGELPQPEKISQQIEAGAGLVLIAGSGITSAELSQLFGGAQLQLSASETPLSLTAATGAVDPLSTDILWNSAPQIRARATLTGLTGFTPLVVGYETGETVLAQGKLGRGQVFIFNASLTGKDNRQLREWTYFNYLVYSLTSRAAARTPLAFVSYGGSPVPHTLARNLLLAIMALILASAFGAFWAVRRYSLRHPEALDQIVANHATFEVREEKTDWDQVGFHRPLSGFLVSLAFSLFLFIPLIIYQNMILPAYILPSAQALGIWGRVVQFFAVTWVFFDMGTSVAFTKYLAQYRIHDPRKAIQYGQFFVWWQTLSGAIQMAIVIWLSSVVAPKTVYAIYAWGVIAHGVIQLPGFYYVYRYAFGGWQRHDYARILDIAPTLILPILIQPVVVSLAYRWGQTVPTVGGAMGGVLGLGLSAYLRDLITFLWGMVLYRRVGYNGRALYLAHFDLSVVKESLRFGVFEMLGSATLAFGEAAEIWVTQARLINYAEIWANWGIANSFGLAFYLVNQLYEGNMPAISEALSNGKRVLSQYYAVMAYKYGGMMSAAVAALILAVADRFILGATGPEFVRAAQYVIPLTLLGAFQYLSWAGDHIQLGANRPQIKTGLLLAGLFVRLGVAMVLIARFQIMGLVIAYSVAVLGKGLASYWINQRFCFPQRFYVWQSLTAPLLAAALHYLFLRWLTGLIWQGDQLTSVIIFFIAILPSFPVYMFLYGLFGGWDAGTLEDVAKAVPLTGFLRPVAEWGFYFPTRLGARLSPLTGRFPIDIRAEALLEAEMLTNEKVRL